jgi:hypothetical protein
MNNNEEIETPIFEGAHADVAEFIDWRSKVYGEPVQCYIRIAQVWSGILGVEVQPTQVVLCMMGLKSVRASITADYSDNSDDIDGYLDIFRRIVGEDMIHASSVASYAEQKVARDGGDT